MTIGDRFGRWTVIETGLRLEYSGGPKTAAKVRCSCGTERVLTVGALTQGRTESCGCLRREKLHAATTSHGLSSHPLYGTWKAMIWRCEHPNAKQYSDYGGRGIRVCDRWHDPAVFIADIERWLGPRPAGKTLDRILNDHDYRLDNVRWATRKQQMANRRSQPNSNANPAGSAYGL
jgi:hypothetical protein